MYTIRIWFFLIILGTILYAFDFLSKTYSEYQVHLITFTVLYFGCWKLSKSIVKKFGGETQIHTPTFTKILHFLYEIASFPFTLVLAIYITIFTILFTLTLLFTDHSFSAWMTLNIGFGLTMGLLKASEPKN